jgi:hypothetical protein
MSEIEELLSGVRPLPACLYEKNGLILARDPLDADRQPPFRVVADCNTASARSIAGAQPKRWAEELCRRANAHEKLLAALKNLLLVSLPTDVSGQRWVDEARAAVASAESA